MFLPVLSPPRACGAAWGTRTPRLIDVYPTFGRLHSCLSVGSKVVRAVLVDCLTPTPVASGRRADEGEAAQSPEALSARVSVATVQS